MPLASQRLSGPGRPLQGRLAWNDELRLALHLMIQHNMGWPQVITVFNKLFEAHVRACGVTKVTKSPLSAQYGERHLPRWQGAIHASDGTIAELKLRIARVVAELQLSVQQSGNARMDHDSRLPPIPMPTPAPRAARARSVKGLTRVAESTFRGNSTNEEAAILGASVAIQEAVVVVPYEERKHALRGTIPVAIRTPPKTPSSQRTRNIEATIRYSHSSSSEIWLTPKQYQETIPDLVHVPYTVAHPPVPLLFRYWDNTCQSPLTDTGFLAGRFSFTIIPPPAPPILGTAQFPFSDFASHLNRDSFYSPFISASNHLVWVLRLALKEARKGKHGRISLIDPTKLDRQAVYHAQPFHRSLCKKRCFTNGAFRYHGMSEFMIWAKVPKNAIISTINVHDILHLARHDQAVGSVLRLDQLGESMRGYTTKILPFFKQQAIQLNATTITALARVCVAFQLDASKVEAVGSAVSDLIQGLGLNLEYKSSNEWAAAASTFAQAMTGGSNGALTFEDFQNTKWTFLNACVWATGDFNTRQKPDKMATMLSRAIRVGLDSPAEILTNELDAAKASILTYARREQQVLQGCASRALLAEPDEIEDEIMVDASEDDEMPRCDSDDDNSNGSVYEL